MTTLSISLSLVDPPPHPNLPAGTHHIAEIMPHVLDCYGLSLELELGPDPVRPAPASEATDLLDVMIACLEGALAS